MNGAEKEAIGTEIDNSAWWMSSWFMTVLILLLVGAAVAWDLSPIYTKASAQARLEANVKRNDKWSSARRWLEQDGWRVEPVRSRSGNGYRIERRLPWLVLFASKLQTPILNPLMPEELFGHIFLSKYDTILTVDLATQRRQAR